VSARTDSDLSSSCSFLGFVAVLPLLYYNFYLRVDLEDFQSTELLQEGFMPALGVFLVRGSAVARFLLMPAT
jgi:hypothetical protein